VIRPGIRRLLHLAPSSRDAIHREVDEELAHHLALRAEQLERAGRSPADAAREAAVRFGDRHTVHQLRVAAERREQRMHRRDIWHGIRQDISYALRSLRAHPAFTITALLSLAFGIGANVVLFTLINGVLLRPLPFPHPDQLYRAWSMNRGAGYDRAWTSPVTFADWRADRRQIADMGGYFVIPGATGFDLGGTGDPERLAGAYVTEGFFSTLEATPVAGRLPRADELSRGGDNHVVVLSYGVWTRRFGRSISIIDSTLVLSGQLYRVVGVMPASFHFPSDAVDLFIPYATLTAEMVPWSRDVHTLSLVVRAKPGVSMAAVHAEMQLLAKRGAAAHAEEAGWDDVAIEPMQAAMTGAARTPLLALAGSVAFLLVMACVNLASLLLARGASRQREVAVRTALGASRWRVIRQLLMESVVLGVAGGGLSLILSSLAVPVLAASGIADVPMHPAIPFGAASIVFGILLSTVTILVFGLLPAWRSASADPQESLRAGGRGAVTRSSHRLRSGLVVAEVALAFVLGTGAMLMLQTFAHLLREDLGFRSDQLVVAGLQIDIGRHPEADQQLLAYYQQLLARLRAEPGLRDVAAVRTPPLTANSEDVAFRTPSMPDRPANQLPTAPNLPVSDGYFGAMGIPVLQGREFTPKDLPDGPRVTVVSDAFAKRYFPGESALNQVLLLGGGKPFRIVGVVGDVHQSGIADHPVPTIYFPYAQSMRSQVTFVARAAQPLAALGAIRRAIHDVDPEQTMTSLTTFANLRRSELARPRLLALLLGAFGVVGVLLGATGVYGVLAYVVTERRRELGVRIALGAVPRTLAATVLARAGLLAIGGICSGAAVAWASTRFLRSVLYGITAHDVTTFVGVAMGLLAVTVVAAWLPARRATRVSPLEALRE
jgi:putative ABC transport system permease protein